MIPKYRYIIKQYNVSMNATSMEKYDGDIKYIKQELKEKNNWNNEYKIDLNNNKLQLPFLDNCILKINSKMESFGYLELINLSNKNNEHYWNIDNEEKTLYELYGYNLSQEWHNFLMELQSKIDSFVL